MDPHQFQPMLMGYIGIVTLITLIYWIDMIFNTSPELLEQLRNPKDD